MKLTREFPGSVKFTSTKMEGRQRKLRSFGSAEEVPGSIVRGSLPLISNPAGKCSPSRQPLPQRVNVKGHDLDLKVIIVSGKQDGSTFLVTGNIHGDEVTGVVVVHRLVERFSYPSLPKLYLTLS